MKVLSLMFFVSWPRAKQILLTVHSIWHITWCWICYVLRKLIQRSCWKNLFTSFKTMLQFQAWLIVSMFNCFEDFWMVDFLILIFYKWWWEDSIIIIEVYFGSVTSFQCILYFPECNWHISQGLSPWAIFHLHLRKHLYLKLSSWYNTCYIIS